MVEFSNYVFDLFANDVGKRLPGREHHLCPLGLSHNIHGSD